MSNGWKESAQAWIALMGERGDWRRQHVLDPMMLSRATARRFERALDVGCGEGRFCRTLRAAGIHVTGIDPTHTLIEHARGRDSSGDYRIGRAEDLQFEAATFDLVVSYLSLINVADFRTAISEMSRVLKPGGSLLIANLTSFVSCAPRGWIKDQNGCPLYYHPVDHYLDEFPSRVEFAGVRIENWHRPLAAYIAALLESGLQLVFFSEPEPVSGEASRQALYRRVPLCLVMEWLRPLAATT